MQLWQQQFIDKSIKGGVIYAAFEQQRSDYAAQSKAPNQGMIRPTIEWHMTDYALPARGATEGARESQMKARFIGKDEFAAINSRHLSPKGKALLLISFSGGQRLFFRGNPNFCKARQTVERWTRTRALVFK